MLTLLKNSIENLKGHKLRLIVAFIWIITGITSVVFVSSVGNAMSQVFKQSFQTIDSKTAIVYFESADSNTNESLLTPFLSSDLQELQTVEGVEKIKSSNKPLTDVISFGDENLYNGNVSYFNQNTSASFASSLTHKYKVVKGRALNASDAGKKVVVIDTFTKETLFEKSDPIGKGITIGRLNFEVVGVCDADSVYDPVDKKFRKKGSFDNVPPYSVVPNDMYNFLSGKNIKTGAINYISVTVKDGFDIPTVAKGVANKMSELHPKLEGEYKVRDQNTIQKSTEAMTKGIDKFVLVITIVAMFVGGIGIMNIMYVSVMERSKEIGIRRALGAKPSTIMYQFLVESVFITSCGGVLGIIVGYAVTMYSKNIMPFRPIPSFNSFLYSFLAIVITGIVFGLVPAHKASKVDPIKIIYK
ncbi:MULTISPECIES: ABC transporter permease [Peptostreptococcus]|jgi:efflux ABC transporter, permease protein|uniref:ABC transporter permease n=1 Tax=Peptostreptococcus TaxID=1257 RepID=UPI001CB43457|nr:MULTISPECIES: FtsX-like permease family protein [Peptostreptococcus]MBF1049959.1 ABC transporter permease [Peptostreptococcus sp.]